MSTGNSFAGVQNQRLSGALDLEFLLSNQFNNLEDSSLIIIRKYVNAIGGKDNLLKIKNRTINLTAEVEGVTGNISIYQEYPDKLLQVNSVNGIEQKIIFNGSKGFWVSNLGTKELAGELLNQLKVDALFNFILDFPEAGIKATYDGIEKIKGKETFKIRFALPDSTIMFEYFDVDTGLKIRQIKNFRSNDNVIQQISDFADYRLIEGVKYPFRIEQEFGPLKSLMEVSAIKVNQNFDDEIFEPK
ncbi:MAG: hypothetical protein C4539_12880 [Ignavibacteriales bacterium]|nr:MAG: hypothetical protein C4539_12880 [Ignavibacteriales bacterium]